MITYNQPIQIAMGWVAFMLVIWLIAELISRYRIYKYNKPINKIQRNHEAITNSNRVIPIKESTDSLVAGFRRMIVNRQKRRLYDLW